jgi:hypothetical protein
MVKEEIKVEAASKETADKEWIIQRAAISQCKMSMAI